MFAFTCTCVLVVLSFISVHSKDKLGEVIYSKDQLNPIREPFYELRTGLVLVLFFIKKVHPQQWNLFGHITENRQSLDMRAQSFLYWLRKLFPPPEAGWQAGSPPYTFEDSTVNHQSQFIQLPWNVCLYDSSISVGSS